MSSNAYWEKRQKQLWEQLEKDESKLKRELEKYYDKELKSLEKDIALYYQKYGEGHVIEYRTLLRELSVEDKRLLMEDMDVFAVRYPQYLNLMPVRESIYKLNRLEGLAHSIYIQQMEIGIIEEEKLRLHLEREFKRGFGAMAQELGFDSGGFNGAMNDAIKKTIGARWASESNFSERIWKNRKDLAAFLNQDFAQGVARGDSYERIIKQMSKRFSDVSRNRMYTLIYTEGTFVMNEATITPFEDDFEEYEYNTIGDSHVCDICSALNGKVFPIKNRMPGTNFPPMHPRCRCSYLIVVGDDFVDDYVARHGGDKGTPASPEFGAENVYHVDFTEYDESPATKKGILKARTELDQYFQITGLHCDGKSFIQRNHKNNVIAQFTPLELANKVQKQVQDSGKDVKIYACNAGAVEATAAQELADLLGVNVKAPTKLIAYYGNDDTFHAIEVDKKGRIITKYKVDAKWKIFKPRNKKK